MYLEKLEIQGFKSFANPLELVFNREMTAIVGPNGSGKSNAADAIRWVTGEQSTKTLRGKKAEDVIFSGSDKKARLGFAQVDLYLNNSDKTADIDYEQVIISRKVDRNGEGEYFINNNKVRLLDVQLLLAKANFGQRTYSVIGQGMIDSILTASGPERKDFFDEATGVRQFQIKKNQSLNKLEGTKKNLEATGQILTELEPRLRSLTRQVKKLERREKIETELKDLQTEYYSFQKNNLDKDLQTSRHSFDGLQKQVSSLNQKLVELQTNLEKEERGSSRQDSFDLLQQKLQQAQSELNSIVKEKTILEGKADLQLMKTGQADIVWLKDRMTSLKNTLSRNKIILSEKQQQLSQAKEEFASLEEKREKILAEFKKLEEKLLNPPQDLSSEDISTALNNILKQQRELQESLERLESLEKIDSLRQKAKSLTEVLSKLWNKVKVSKEDNRGHWQGEFNKLLMTKDTLVSEIGDARTSTAIVRSEVDKLKKDIEEDTHELNKLEADQQSLLGKQGEDSGIKDQLSQLQAKVEKHNKDIEEIENKIKDFNRQEEAKKQSLVKSQKEFRQVQEDFNQKNNQLNEVKVGLARLETRWEELIKEINEEISDLQVKKVSNIDLSATKDKILNLKNQLSIIGGIDELVLEEYKEVSERYNFLNEQTTDLNEAIKHLEKIIKDLDESISDQFNKSFQSINKLFDKYFKKLFSGGKAELILNIKEVFEEEEESDEGDEEEGDDEEQEKPIKKKVIKKEYGIDIKATPPGKRLSSINMLSGGEKALTSIALICAIIANNPSPFVVLDEVDAALDEANSVRFVEILDELSDKTQFIAITHNRATMHKAKIIYGVTMGDDRVSKLLSVNFDQADEIAA
ncbi:AAA family ATPase [Candidatus Parcubacteria bacterium]|nr:AAA family ATPase [Candidatus Parcubacteria bacterium]